jgi:hypothetical protein
MSFSEVTSFKLSNCFHYFDGTYCLLLRVVKVEEDAVFLSSKKENVKVKFILEQAT